MTGVGAIASSYAPAGGGGAFTPADLPGVAIYLDADDATAFTYHSGSIVSNWADTAGSANVATSGTSGTAPTRVTNVLNGKAVVRFASGSSQYLEVTEFGTSFTAAEVFIVVKINNDPPGGANATGLWSFSDSGEAAHYPWTDSVVYESFGTTFRKTTGNPTPSLASWRLYNVRSASGAWSSHIDGTQHYSTASNAVSMGSSLLPYYLLGASYSAQGFYYYLDGDVACLVICDQVLASGDRDNMHAWVESQYGLTIA